MDYSQFSFPDTNHPSKEEHLEVSEKVLKEFGYPARAKHLVEYIESQYKEEFNGRSCYVEYVIGFAARKWYWDLEDVSVLVDGEFWKQTERVRKSKKEIRSRKFKSQKDLLA